MLEAISNGEQWERVHPAWRVSLGKRQSKWHVPNACIFMIWFYWWQHVCPDFVCRFLVQMATYLQIIYAINSRALAGTDLDSKRHLRSCKHAHTTMQAQHGASNHDSSCEGQPFFRHTAPHLSCPCHKMPRSRSCQPASDSGLKRLLGVNGSKDKSAFCLPPSIYDVWKNIRHQN